MKTLHSVAAMLTIIGTVPAWAQETTHRLGDHPAVIVKRLEGKQGYDYAAQFYPHPAWLYLSTEPEHPMMDHPAVIVAKRLRRESTEHHLAQAEKADADNTH